VYKKYIKRVLVSILGFVVFGLTYKIFVPGSLVVLVLAIGVLFSKEHYGEGIFIMLLVLFGTYTINSNEYIARDINIEYKDLTISGNTILIENKDKKYGKRLVVKLRNESLVSFQEHFLDNEKIHKLENTDKQIKVFIEEAGYYDEIDKLMKIDLEKDIKHWNYIVYFEMNGEKIYSGIYIERQTETRLYLDK